MNSQRKRGGATSAPYSHSNLQPLTRAQRRCIIIRYYAPRICCLFLRLDIAMTAFSLCATPPFFPIGERLNCTQETGRDRR